MTQIPCVNESWAHSNVSDSKRGYDGRTRRLETNDKDIASLLSQELRRQAQRLRYKGKHILFILAYCAR